jgi:hypothetical protein
MITSVLLDPQQEAAVTSTAVLRSSPRLFLFLLSAAVAASFLIMLLFTTYYSPTSLLSLAESRYFHQVACELIVNSGLQEEEDETANPNKIKKHTQTKPNKLTEKKIRSDENNQSFVVVCATEEEEDDATRTTTKPFVFFLPRRNQTPRQR